ncbi:MAG: AAA family ATPase [Paracoccaceae bacterium]
MKDHVDQPTPAKGTWPAPKAEPSGLDDAGFNAWKEATDRTAELAQKNGWTKAEFSRRAEMPQGTFSGWYDGTYAGRFDTTTAKVVRFLDAAEDAAAVTAAIPQDPGFVATETARKLMDGFRYAQHLATMSVCTIGSGMGKSTTARHYAAITPHVTVVTLSPSSRRPHILKTEIAAELGVDTKDSSSLKAAIVRSLRKAQAPTLLIADEAQNLDEDCINELRHFVDVGGCGLVLLGNDEVTTPYATRDAKNNSPQIARRVGHRLNILKPSAGDIEAFLDAWSIDDDALRKVAVAIANRPGALGALAETIRAAGMIAQGLGSPITAEVLRAAYERRGGGAV